MMQRNGVRDIFQELNRYLPKYTTTMYTMFKDIEKVQFWKLLNLVIYFY